MWGSISSRKRNDMVKFIAASEGREFTQRLLIATSYGDADTIVDLNASQMIHAAFEKITSKTGLVVSEGAGHGFSEPEDRARATDALVSWFETHLTH